MTHCKNIIIIQLTLLPTYLSDLKTMSSVEQLKNFKYLSFSYNTEDLLIFRYLKKIKLAPKKNLLQIIIGNVYLYQRKQGSPKYNIIKLSVL